MQGQVDSRFKDEFVINGLNIILKRITLVMGYLEVQLFKKLDRKYGSEISGHFREKWMRFLDDCFILWNSTVPVDKLWEELNSIHPKIQFTMECSETQLPFLDVLVKLNDGRISTDIYFKPTDTRLYLNKTNQLQEEHNEYPSEYQQFVCIT